MSILWPYILFKYRFFFNELRLKFQKESEIASLCSKSFSTILILYVEINDI